MFTTSFAAAVVGGMLASGSLESPKWQSSYREASVAALDQRKPLAVFISAGPPTKLVKEGVLGKESSRLLRDGYVVLSVNTSTEAGKELAQTFQLAEGLVISDRSGKLQALRHNGRIADAELSEQLNRFQTSSTVATTEYRGVSPQPAVNAPTIAGTINRTPVYQQSYVAPGYYPQQYEQPRPILNAVQNIGGFVQNVGQNAVQNVGGFVQNVGQNTVQNIGGFVQNARTFVSGSS